MIWLGCVCVSQERGAGVSVRRDEQVLVGTKKHVRRGLGLVLDSTMLIHSRTKSWRHECRGKTCALGSLTMALKAAG